MIENRVTIQSALIPNIKVGRKKRNRYKMIDCCYADSVMTSKNMLWWFWQNKAVFDGMHGIDAVWTNLLLTEIKRPVRDRSFGVKTSLLRSL